MRQKLSKGFILTGALGSGKDLFVKALAKTFHCELFFLNPASLFQDRTGFQKLRSSLRYSIESIVFISHIDWFARSRHRLEVSEFPELDNYRAKCARVAMRNGTSLHITSGEAKPGLVPSFAKCNDARCFRIVQPPNCVDDAKQRRLVRCVDYIFATVSTGNQRIKITSTNVTTRTLGSTLRNEIQRTSNFVAQPTVYASDRASNFDPRAHRKSGWVLVAGREHVGSVVAVGDKRILSDVIFPIERSDVGNQHVMRSKSLQLGSPSGSHRATSIVGNQPKKMIRDAVLHYSNPFASCDARAMQSNAMQSNAMGTRWGTQPTRRRRMGDSTHVADPKSIPYRQSEYDRLIPMRPTLQRMGTKAMLVAASCNASCDGGGWGRCEATSWVPHRNPTRTNISSIASYGVPIATRNLTQPRRKLRTTSLSRNTDAQHVSIPTAHQTTMIPMQRWGRHYTRLNRALFATPPRTALPGPNLAPPLTTHRQTLDNIHVDALQDAVLSASLLSQAQGNDVGASVPVLRSTLCSIRTSLPPNVARIGRNIYTDITSTQRSTDAQPSTDLTVQRQSAVLAQFLVCLDISFFQGFLFMDTNNFQELDKAFIRPGRFDRVIHFEFPTPETRVKILNYSYQSSFSDLQLSLLKYENGHRQTMLSRVPSALALSRWFPSSEPNLTLPSTLRSTDVESEPTEPTPDIDSDASVPGVTLQLGSTMLRRCNDLPIVQRQDLTDPSTQRLTSKPQPAFLFALHRTNVVRSNPVGQVYKGFKVTSCDLIGLGTSFSFNRFFSTGTKDAFSN